MWPKKFVDGQIVNILTSVLGQYVILDQDQLQLSLWSGTCELRNLAIRPDILTSITNPKKNNNNNNTSSSDTTSTTPTSTTSANNNTNANAIKNNIKLERGTIDLCKVTVPWASLDSEPLVVEIEGIDLRFNLDIYLFTSKYIE